MSRALITALLLLGACHRKSAPPTSPPPPCEDHDAHPDDCDDDAGAR